MAPEPPSAPPSGLRVALEYPLPPALPGGRATALFLYGHCFGVRARVQSLELLVGGRRHRPDAWRMPRLDLHRWLGATAQDPGCRSYRSGFWATVRVPPQAVGAPLRIAAAVRLMGSAAETILPLGEIPVLGGERRARASQPAPGTICVCMATYEPDPALFAAQIATLRAQTDPRWICVISDGGSSEHTREAMRATLGGDDRFRMVPSPERLDPYRNFERALRLAPEDAELVALADQDDRWYPDKLAALRAALGPAELVYSDLRLVDAEGRLLRESLWPGRRHDRSNLASLLVANTAPGAAMLFRRELCERALPFPRPPGIPYHDHWLALVALAAGELAYVDRPLYDYVQHRTAVQGAVVTSATIRSRRGVAGTSRGWRAAYFGGYLVRRLQAETLLARAGPQLTPRKRRALRLMAAAERSPGAFLWLALRPLRRAIGRDETLGGEVALVCGIAWRWVVAIAVAGRARPGCRPWDASLPDPPQFEQRRLRRWRGGGR